MRPLAAPLAGCALRYIRYCHPVDCIKGQAAGGREESAAAQAISPEVNA
jgi:hypothetical protein